MKKSNITTLILFLILSSVYSASNAGTLNDDPCSAVALTVGTTCNTVTGDNTGATNSSVPDETCDGAASEGDLWYSAVVPANGTLIIETYTGGLTDIGMAIYTGSSCSSLTTLYCVPGGMSGTPNMPYKSMTGLTPGDHLWIRIWDVDNDETGSFGICAYANCAGASVTITGAASACAGTSTQLCTSIPFSSYSWSTSATTACINVTSANTYSVTVTDASGCTASDSHVFSINSLPSVSITGPPSKCSNSSETLCAPNTFSSYLWSNSATTNCITPTSTATYVVTVTDIHGCTGSASQLMTVHNPPAVSITGPSNACPGSNPQLCVASGFSVYSWSNGGTANCIIPPSTGTYSVTVTDGFSCTNSASKLITFYTPPSPSITGPASACAGASVQLCVPAGFVSYTWSNSATTNCTTPSATGAYTVIVTDGNGCTGTDSHNFTLNTLPNSTISGPTNTCNGASAQLCAPAGSSFYLWSNSSTSSCISTTTSGTYTVVVTGSNGCTSSSSQTLSVHPAFAMSVSGPSTACSGSNPQLCATSGPYTYSWSNGATVSCINPSVSGTYTVVATSAAGCTRSASKGLTVYSPLNATITGPSSACIGSTIPLCASAGSTSYAWSTGETTDCITVNSNGTYSVIISDVHGCTASASNTVTFSSTFSVDITGPLSGCNGSAASLCVPAGYTSYAWSTGGTTECINVTTPGNYSVTVHDPVGCVANSFYTIPFNPPPVVNITGSTIICTGGIANWCATSGYEAYQWSNGGTAECINISKDTTYTIMVTDTNGCTATASAALAVVNIAPNIIESNGILICDTINTHYVYVWKLNGIPTGCTGDSCQTTFSGTYTVSVTDTVTGCTEDASYNFITNGISENELSNSVIIYPNPFSGNEFKIDFDGQTSGKTEVEISDALGKIILRDEFMVGSGKSTKTFTLPAKAEGIYFVSVKNGKGVVVKRIISN